MQNLKLKRRALELSHLEAHLTQGRGSYHFENLEWFRVVVRHVLRASGMLPRGERNALRPIVRDLRFEFSDLPPAFDGYRILHLSDIHADGLAGLADVIHDQVRALPADLCVMTGDYRFEIHGPCHNVYHAMKRILSGISARRGIVGILGNHDFAEEADALRDMGVTMLINESLELQEGADRLWLVGLDDPHFYGCDDLPGALANVPADAFKILLVHTPEMLDEAVAAGIRLYLCGHTHGGQMCLPWVGPLIVNASCPRRYTRGVWQFKEMQGYTSAGIGSSGVAARFNCPPEIAMITLRRSTASRNDRGDATSPIIQPTH